MSCCMKSPVLLMGNCTVGMHVSKEQEERLHSTQKFAPDMALTIRRSNSGWAYRRPLILSIGHWE